MQILSLSCLYNQQPRMTQRILERRCRVDVHRNVLTFAVNQDCLTFYGNGESTDEVVVVLLMWPSAEVETVVSSFLGWGFHQLSTSPPRWDSRDGLGVSQEAGQPDL